MFDQLLAMARRDKLQLPTADRALPGRDHYAFAIPAAHAINGTPMQGPWPGTEQFLVGMGCFWGAERKFWQTPGVVNTAVGYAAGLTPHPTYKEVCSGGTGHNEVVRVVFDPRQVSFEALLKVFWESHDPTQGMRQGNDVGTQYRSGIYTTSEAQAQAARASQAAFQTALDAAGHGRITTEILPAPEFYFAEEYHQQYLHRNPMGYCNHGFCQVSYD